MILSKKCIWWLHKLPIHLWWGCQSQNWRHFHCNFGCNNSCLDFYALLFKKLSACNWLWWDKCSNHLNFSTRPQTKMLRYWKENSPTYFHYIFVCVCLWQVSYIYRQREREREILKERERNMKKSIKTNRNITFILLIFKMLSASFDSWSLSVEIFQEKMIFGNCFKILKFKRSLYGKQKVTENMLLE